MTGAPADDAWSLRRLRAVLAATCAGALLVIAGLGYWVWTLVHGAPASAEQAETAAHAIPAEGQGRRDALAAQPMLSVLPEDGDGGTPATQPPAAMKIPTGHDSGPSGVLTGYPHTPEGAVGQLAAIEVSVLQHMDLRQAREVHAAWSLPGAMTFEDWEVTYGVRSFLGNHAIGGAKRPTTRVVVTPVGAQIKGADGPDWTLACALVRLDASDVTSASRAASHGERMQWQPDGSAAGGRWMIAPGSPPAPAPATWPGTELAVKAGWLNWASERGSD